MSNELTLLRGNITPTETVSLKLIHGTKLDRPEFGLTDEGLALRDNYVVTLAAFSRCDDYTTAQAISDVAGKAKAFTAQVKKERLELTRPADVWKSLAMDFERGACGPLDDVLEAAGRLVAGWQLQERRRADAEAKSKREAEAEALRIAQEAQQKAAAEAARAQRIGSEAANKRAEQARLQAEASEMAARNAISEPAPVASHAKGTVFRMVTKWEITDEKALYAVMPHFFKLEPNRVVINASVTAKTVLPGIKTWDEAAGDFRSAK